MKDDMEKGKVNFVINAFPPLFALSVISPFTRAETMINVNYATIVAFLESMNSFAEEALNFPSNEKYVVEPVPEEVPRVTPASREGTLFVTPLKAVCAIHLIQKPYYPLDG